MGGFAGVSGACFGLDLLPIGKDGRPANPARDQNLAGYAGRLTGCWLPIVVGILIKYFPSHQAAFKTFFIIGGSLSLFTTSIFWLCVYPRDEELDRPLQCTRHWFYSEYDKVRRSEGDAVARRKFIDGEIIEPRCCKSCMGKGAGGATIPCGVGCCDVLLLGFNRDGGDPYLDPLLSRVAEEPEQEFDSDTLPIEEPPPVVAGAPKFNAARALQ